MNPNPLEMQVEEKKSKALKFLENYEKSRSISGAAKSQNHAPMTLMSWVERFYPDRLPHSNQYNNYRKKVKNLHLDPVPRKRKRPEHVSPQLLSLTLPEPKLNRTLLQSLLQSTITNLQTIQELIKDV